MSKEKEFKFPKEYNRIGFKIMSNKKNNSWEEEFDKFLQDKFDNKHKKTKGETHSWLFCWDSEQDSDPPFDCACCLDKNRDEGQNCQCICHYRIRQLKSFIRKTRKDAIKEDRAILLERAEIAENTINHIEDTLSRVLPREYMLEMIGKIITKHKSEITEPN